MKNTSLLRKIAIFILIIDALILVSFMFDLGFLYKFSKSVIENFSFSPDLTKWLEIILLLITGSSQVPIFLENKRNKIIAIVITVLSFVIYFAAAYFYTNGYHYNFDGKVNWYIVTPSCEIKFSDSPGIDPEYGFSYKKVDSNVIIAHKWLKGERADKLGRAFQFCEEINSTVKIYDNPFSTHPCEIRPICSKEQLEKYQHQQDAILKQQTKKQNLETIKKLLKEALDKSKKCSSNNDCEYEIALDLINQARNVDPSYSKLRDFVIVENKVAKIHKATCQFNQNREIIESVEDPENKPINELKESISSPEVLESLESKNTSQPAPLLKSPEPRKIFPSPNNVETLPKYSKALMVAVAKGQRDRVEQLLLSIEDINAQDEFGKTALIIAIENNHDKLATFLLEKQADINIEDKYAMTALLLAAKGGHNQLAAKILLKGANINHQNKKGETALILAARGGHDEVVRCLLLNRANTKLKDNSGLAAIDHAIQNKKAQVIDILKGFPK